MQSPDAFANRPYGTNCANSKSLERGICAVACKTLTVETVSLTEATICSKKNARFQIEIVVEFDVQSTSELNVDFDIGFHLT